MILDQVDSSGRDSLEDYHNSGLALQDAEMTGVCGELKRRGHHLDTVPEVPTAGQVQVLASPPRDLPPHAPNGLNHGPIRLGTNNNGKTGARCRATMKLELASGHSVSRPGRALKQRPLALFKARMAQVQQSRSPNRSAGSPSGQYCTSFDCRRSVFSIQCTRKQCLQLLASWAMKYFPFSCCILVSLCGVSI